MRVKKKRERKKRRWKEPQFVKSKVFAFFCGSYPGKDEEFLKVANNLGQTLAERKIRLVYGGGNIGLMGCVATAVQSGGGQNLSIIPRALAMRGIVGKTIGNEILVSCIHERMNIMMENADAFIALPGGFGTLEEIFQIASWAQLNIHKKPIGVLNVNGFYDGLFSFLDKAVEQRFISQATRQILVTATTLDQLLDQLQAFVPKPDPSLALLDWSTSSSNKRKLNLTLYL
ncbi:hypothetical protein REPUB_Repub05bG0108300 [Reevesia pubescens]